MKKPFRIFFILFTLFCCEAKTQTNLVYNGDFEIYDTCPNNCSFVGDLQLNKCKGWYAPTMGTSDYFNICSNNIFPLGFNVGVPKNVIGYQAPHSGNGYIGLFSFANTLSTQCIYREYVQTKLISPLILGKQYVLEYYVSMANYQAAVNSISALFSINKIITNNDCAIIANPQIKYTDGFISDSLNWTKITGTFTAIGGEEYLTLGFFEDTTNLSGVLPLLPDSITSRYNSSYYYVDGVSLTESACIIKMPTIFTPNNDGANDVLYFNFCDNVRNTIIYNRWGNIVFKTESTLNHWWDGSTTDGEQCSEGTYFYIIQAGEKTYKGFIQLLR